jgi:hypothetical protein
MPQRFLKRVHENGPDECLEYSGVRTKRYGMFFLDGKFRMAHRVAYSIHYGPIPDGLEMCHKCDNGFCCNPNHLWLGTHRDNMRDCISKGRFVNATAHRGRRGSKYTPEFIAKLKKEFKPYRVTALTLSKKYAIPWQTIRNLIYVDFEGQFHKDHGTVR